MVRKSSGATPIVYDIFVSGERIVIHVDIDELEELMPPEEAKCDLEHGTGLVDSLGCIRYCLKNDDKNFTAALEDFMRAAEELGMVEDKDSFLDRIEMWGEDENDDDE